MVLSDAAIHAKLSFAKVQLISDTIAFHTVLTTNPTIPYGSAVLFDEVLLNEGEG